MNPTNVTDRYLAEFEAFAGNGASGAPAWLKSLRQDAIGRFAEIGFPTTRQEAWRFTSVRAIVDKHFSLAPRVADVSLEQFRAYLPGDGPRVVFVNGRYEAGLSSVGSLPKGVFAGSLASAIEGYGDLVQQHLGKHTPVDANGFAALNAAFAADGAFVYVPKNTRVEAGVQLVFLTAGGDEPVMTHPRNLIVVEDGGDVRIVEIYAGLRDSTYLTNAVTEVVVGAGARAECYRIQRESEQAYNVATTHSTQGRDSAYALHALALGSDLGRHDIRMVLDGEGGEGILNGLYLMRHGQHIDHNTVIEHAKPHCESHEYFNGILDDRSHGVFNGRIIVRPGAQKTDSKQTNNNLLLSDNARADSQPQLEIYADDVRCTHGATLGPLDDNALFYLQSRGLEATAARDMLTYGYGVEIVDRMKLDPVRSHLDELVRTRLHENNVRRRTTS